MRLRREDLLADPDRLAELVLRLAADNERLRATLRSINTLHFGPSSERLVALVDDQMTLGRGDLADGNIPPPPEAANADDAVKPKASPKGFRKPARRNNGALAKHLPRCEQVIEPEAPSARAAPARCIVSMNASTKHSM